MVEEDVFDDQVVRFLQQRIRELEGERKKWHQTLSYAQTELEAIKGMGPNRVRELEERISKAREILEDGWKDNNPLAMREALAALEGK